MDLFDMVANNEEESFTDSKKDVLKFKDMFQII